MSSALTIGSVNLITQCEGLTSPSGVDYSYLAISEYPVYRDPTTFPEPEVYKPFRFAELCAEDVAREATAGTTQHN